MEERSGQAAALERPIQGTDEPSGAQGPPHLADPRALQILTTEHWSLLTARSLVYNEAFARAGMFMTFLTGSLVALGFVSQGSGFGSEFLAIATALLGFDLFIGLATLGRINAASVEEFRSLQGMNRLRHAYLEMVPSLEPYFSSSTYDDLPGVLSIYGPEPAKEFALGDIVHGFTTTPGMIATITSAVGGAFAATLALLLGASSTLGIVAGFVGFVIIMSIMFMVTYRRFTTVDRHLLEVRFPTPPRGDRDDS
jgi:hypothetical protein